jgi:pyruvate,water dikinase
MTTVQRPGWVEQELILDLACLGPQLLPVVGGKAANLGELIRAGLRVPPGFCVTTAAYQQIAAAAELGAVIDAAGPGAQEAGRLVELAERARTVILASPVPAAVADAVDRAYRALGDDVPVAVRSSATAEDLPTASFAGQQDTYLNVVGADAVLDAVRRCWASLWTDRAVSYRAANGIDHSTVQLAVVVQRMIDPRVAGVLFTADPVTGHRGHTVIDASPGLGEAVVSGAVNPDHFVVDAAGTVLERRLGDKRVVVRSLPGGGTEHSARPADTQQPCLSDGQIRDLTVLGQRVQVHYHGAPQDIEWALDGAGALWLTQARAITTLYPLPTPPERELRVYLCLSLAQGLTRPITPMGMAAFRLIASCASEVVFGSVVSDPLAGPAAFAEAGQRPFIDVTPVLHSRVGRVLVPRILDVMEARSAVVLRRLGDGPRLAERTRSRWPFLRRLLAVAVRFRIPLQIAQALVSPAAARRRVDHVGRRLRSRLTVPAGVTGGQRLDHTQHLLGTVVIPIMPTITPVAGAGFLAQALAGKLARAELEPGESDEVLRGLPHNVTTTMDLRLWALASRVRTDPTATAALQGTAPAVLAQRFTNRQLPPLLQRGLEEFLAQHGHRAVAEIDVGMPRWSDDPTHIVGVLANYLRLQDPDLAPDAQFARGARAADATVTRVVSRVRRRSRLRATAVRVALGRARELVGLRETHKDYLVRVLAHVREQLAAVGAELAGRGLLAKPDDVFFLDLVQARAALEGRDVRAVVTQRREGYERELRRRQVPRVMLSDGTVPEALAAADQVPAEGQLTGTPASAGTETATARVVLDPVGAHLEPGEILVAPSTDPGWTPLFLTAGGLVMEMGGANSHGAVVAREYGIPAVVGVPDATLRITTGQRITVHGTTGLIELP